MPESSSLPGFGHFLEQTEAIGVFVLAVLVLMSVVSWCQIILKAWQQWRVRAASQRFLDALARARNAQEVEALLTEAPPEEPFGCILAEGLEACRLLRSSAARRAFTLTSPDDFIHSALEGGIANEEYALEKGLSILASVGSTAPFVGLFGTVWGIYHALISIGVSGQAGLDQVAGPVGEALIMTACGLAVAIPAVLAYNAFARANRNLVGKMENHAHRVFALLATGELPNPLPSTLPESRALALDHPTAEARAKGRA
jgi:biopolymer transport protein ExbB